MATYSYKYRPCCGFTGHLIEFYKGSERNELIPDLLESLKVLQLTPEPIIDLWMNDELIAPFKTKLGDIQVSKDIYDNVFIMGSDDTILKIHELLNQHINYKSLAVDYKDYELKK